MLTVCFAIFQVNEILNVATITSDQTSLKAVTDFQPSELHVDATAGTLTQTVIINGKTLADGDKVKSATTTGAITTSNVGITIKDFERFRQAQDEAQLALQAKIDEILLLSTVDCDQARA